MDKYNFKKDLIEVLLKHRADIYCDLNVWMLSEHMIRWIDEYCRQRDIAKDWKPKQTPQQSYHDALKQFFAENKE